MFPRLSEMLHAGHVIVHFDSTDCYRDQRVCSFNLRSYIYFFKMLHDIDIERCLKFKVFNHHDHDIRRR